MRRHWTGVACLGVLCIAGGATNAETNPFAGGVEIEGWRYTPIVTGEAGQQQVHSFLGLLNPPIAAGANITAIWYVRDSAGWQPQAWTSENEWKVVEAVKSQLGISDSFDNHWLTWTAKDSSASASGQSPAPYGQGFLYADPLGEAFQESPFRDQLVSALLAIGYSVADVEFEKTSSAAACPSTDVLDSLAAGVEAEINSPWADGEIAASAALAQRCAGLCVPWTWWGPLSGWTCGPWGGFGAPVQKQRVTIGGTQIQCCYSCTRTCTQTQTVTHRFRNCSRTSILQTQTMTDTYEVCCDDTGTLTQPGTTPAPCTAIATCFDNSVPPSPGTAPTRPGTPGPFTPPLPW